MTRRPDTRNIVGWGLLGLCILALAGMYVLVLVTLPVVCAWLTSVAVVAYVTWWATGRNLRAELEAARANHTDNNGATVRQALADLGSVSDKAFAHQALVAALLASWAESEPDPDTLKAAGGMATELLWNLEGQGCRVIVPGREPAPASDPEPPEWMDQSGYRPPPDIYSFLSDEPDYAGWADGITADSTVEHLGQACGWSEDGSTFCGAPSVGYVELLIGHPVPVCESHYQWACHSDGSDDWAEDDDAETLPSGERID